MSANEISNEVYAAARAVFPAPEWYTVEEVSIPGSHGRRRADLIALSIWGPTRAIVCEIKATRSDFLNEIRDPEKRAAGVRFGTEFAFIVPHGLVDVDEVPEGCGLYEVQRNRRVRRVKIGKQKPHVEWTGAMFHNLFKAIVYRSDRTYHAFHDAGQDGAKIYRGLFRSLGKEWTLDELIDLTRSLYRGLAMRKEEIKAASMDYHERMSADPEVQRLRLLERKVRSLCGYNCGTADRFEDWHKANASKAGTLSTRDLSGLRHAKDNIERFIELYGEEGRT